MGGVINRGTKDKPLWYIRYVDTDGRRKQRKTGAPTKALARRVLDDVEGRIAIGKVGVPDPTDEERLRQTRTVLELADLFLQEYAPPRIKDIQVYRSQARTTLRRRILPALGHLPAASVRPLDVERLRDRQLAGGLKPGSVAQTLATLSRLYSWALRAGYLACPNPVAAVERTRAAQSLDYLTHEEVAALLEYVAGHAPERHAIVATALYTGMRKGELFGLRWRDLALDAGRVDVMRSYRLLPKSGKPRHLPLNPELAPILRGWRSDCPRTDEGLVFPVRSRSGDWRMGTKEDMLGLPAMMRAAGVHALEPGVKPWHALRHTFASHFMMAGGNILTLQKLLGHADLKMTMVYAHLGKDFLASEVARMSFAAAAPAGVADLGELRRQRA